MSERIDEELATWLAQLPGEEADEHEGFRLLSREAIDEVPWQEGYVEPSERGQFLSEHGIETLPFATDGSSNYLAVYANGPLAGRVVFVDHESLAFELVLPSVRAVREAFEREERFADYRFEAPSDLKRDARHCDALVAFAREHAPLSEVGGELVADAILALSDDAQASRRLAELGLAHLDPTNDLNAVVERGDLARARELLGGADPDDATAALELAASRSNAEMVRLFVSEGVRVSDEAVACAVSGTPDLLGVLKDAYGRGDVAFWCAALRRAGLAPAESIAALLDLGMPLDAQDEEGTALAKAIFWNRPETVALLFERGARSFGSSPLVEFGWDDEHLVLVDDLVRRFGGAALEPLRAGGPLQGGPESLLTFAVRKGAIDTARALLDAGFDVMADPAALREALYRGQSEIAALLDARGAPLEAVDYACAWSFLTIGNDIQASDEERLALIDLCERRGLCIPEEPPPDQRELWGHPPGILLLFSIQSGFEKTAAALLRLGYRADAIDQGNSTLDWAAYQGMESVVETLLGRELPITSAALDYSASAGHSAIVRRLLDLRPELLDAPHGDDAETALCGAAENGHAEVVALLLERGARKDLARADRKTPLALARENGHEAVVELLTR